MEMLLSDSDSESFMETSGSEDLDDIDYLFSGQAQSILSNLERSIGKIDDFLAFERGFVHGDIVCSITDPSAQFGKVVDVDIFVDLETVYGDIVKEVNCKNLLKIRSFVVGDYVIHGPWLGRVRSVIDCVTILFDDGAKCEVTVVDPETLVPISPNAVEDTPYPYYPGQRVRIRFPSAFKSARWLCDAWKRNRVEGTVYHVEARLVYVDWVASVIGCDPSMSSPPCPQDSKNLTLLSCFLHASWQLGDWCMLPTNDQRVVKEHIHGHKNVERGLWKSNTDLNVEDIYVIVKRKTKVDVLWQDGTHSVGLNSQSLLPVNSVGDHEFWPEQFVLEKGTCDDPYVSSGPRLGIVKSVDAKERTVKLKWKTCAECDSDGECTEETVSAYELIEHPDYNFCLGEIVFVLGSTFSVVQADGQKKCEGHLITEMGISSFQQLGKGAVTSKQVNEGLCEYPEKSYLSCIGNVIGFKDGGVEVKWASGHTSKVAPFEIVGIDKYEDSAPTPILREENIDDSLTQETPEFDEQSWQHQEKVKDDVLEKATNGAGESCKEHTWETSTFFLPRAAIGFFTNVAASLFGTRGSSSLSGSMDNNHSGNLSEIYNLDLNISHSEGANKCGSLHKSEVMEFHNLTSEGPSSIVDDLETMGQTNLEQVEETQEKKEISFPSSNDKPGQFKQFDTVGDFSDHHFVNNAGKGSILAQVKRGWLKKVQQEWSILEKDLPDTIYVRVYEERIDLLRVAIVGAPGTPYHDGLFFFDFFLPPDYPHEPPLVHYNSGGLRVNPNLYESGRVCLSLLNTWMGTGTEAWKPDHSTILQVLLSLQALVLNEKPYFNEAGYDKQMGRAEGEKNSITYNENAFLLSCKSMLYVLRKPPKNFELFVEEHFRRCSYSVLLACKAYMDGAPVGCANSCEVVEGETQKGCSTGFKIMLAKLVPKLISGFTEKGIDCSQFLEQENDCITK